MAQLDSSIILGNVYKPPSYGDIMDRREAIQMRHIAQNRADEAYATQQRQMKRQEDAGSMAAHGDFAGAREAAGSDFDLHGEIGKLEGSQREATQKAIAVGVPVILGVADIPDDPTHAARKAYIQQQMPRLSSAGISPEFLSSIDYSDQGLQRLHDSVISVGDSIKSHENDRAFAEKSRHNLASEALAGEKTYVSSGYLPPAVGGGTGQPSSGFTPVPNGRSVIEKIFPGVHVTDNLRDPNSKLGRKTAGSWHLKSGAAVDVRPIPGMTFEQYVDGIKSQGYHIIQALDEVKHPSPNSTGPHWHVVIGAKNVPVQNSRPTLTPIPGGKADRQSGALG
jgi:hypothetical protein